jgi:putative ABC transport system permease protein
MSSMARSSPSLTDILRMGGEGLGRYPLRTALSVLGVVVGTAAVFAMLSVNEGGRREVLREVERFGLENLVAHNRPVSGARPRWLTVGDADRLRVLVPRVMAAACVVRRTVRVSGPSAAGVAPLTAAGPEFQAIARLPVLAGRPLGSLDDGASRCLVGRRLAGTLFGPSGAVGGSVRIDDRWFRVVGVVGERGPVGQTVDRELPDLDNGVIVPLGSILRRPPRLDPGQRVDQIWLRADRADHAVEAGARVQHALAGLNGGAADVDVLVPRTLLDQRLRAQRTFNVVAGTIAGLSLLVGGIGIMNVMLASVAARTEEIGLRRAVGATTRSIVTQFLAESVLMTAAGGVAGLVAGAAAAWSITRLAGWPTLVSPWAGSLALAVSLAVGLGSGVYPALRAARLDPIDAVRHE